MKETKIKEFTLKDSIGVGEESLIFRCASPSNPELAIKITQITDQDRALKDLFSEAKILSKMKNVRGFPEIHDCGSAGNMFFLVMDLLGPSLEDFLQFCKGKLSLKTILLLGFQMVRALILAHSRFSLGLAYPYTYTQ